MTGRELPLLDVALELLGDGAQSDAVDLLLELRDEPKSLPPLCDICGVRAWPGDQARHVFSAHYPVRRAA